MIQLVPVSKSGCKELVLFLTLCFFIVESLVVAFFDRRLLSVSVAVVCVRQSWTCRRQDRSLGLVWICLCVVLAAFAFLPTVGKESDSTTVKINWLSTFQMFSAVLMQLPTLILESIKILDSDSPNYIATEWCWLSVKLCYSVVKSYLCSLCKPLVGGELRLEL